MATMPQAPASTAHPLDPLGPAEIEAAVAILRDGRPLSERTRIMSVTLREPTRAAIRAAAARAAERAPGLAQASERTQLERLRAQGMVTPEPKPEFVAAMRAIGERMANEWAQRAGAEGQQALERYRAMVR